MVSNNTTVNELVPMRDKPYESLQEMFDIVLAHSRKMDERSVHLTWAGAFAGCAYRSEKGNNMCFVGCLIPDGMYDSKMEGCPALVAIAQNTELDKLIFHIVDGCSYRNRGNFLESLQDIHDNHPEAFWEAQLKRIAEDFGLEYKEEA